MLIPCTNTLIDIEFNRFLPKEYQIFTGRLQMGPINEAGWKMQDADIDYQARLLGTAGMEMIILAATSASFFVEGYDAEVTRRIREASGVPAYVTAALIAAAAKELGTTRIGLVSPFDDGLTARGTEYFRREHGLEVLAVERYGYATTADAVSGISPELAEQAMERANSPQVEALVIPGGNFPTLHRIDEWEQRFGKPVLTTNQCSMWAIMREFGAREPLSTGGRLLRKSWKK